MSPNAAKQTVYFNLQARLYFDTRKHVRMSVWEAIELLNNLVDESDPDVSSFVAVTALTRLYTFIRQVCVK
jgi:hypothetical protein